VADALQRLTPEAKQALSATIRSLRERLLRDLGDEAERRYRMSVSIAQAGLAEAPRRRRARLEAWLDERARSSGAKSDKDRKAARDRFLLQAIKEAAATLLNRLVLLRHLEAMGLSRPAVVIGGWNSAGYQELRDFAPGLLGDETEGYATLLQLKFDDLAVELPGLFGDVGLTRLFHVPPATLREIVGRLDDDVLASAWTDDTTLGWVYQYWNDPEREALDAKINDGGKIAPHEIASKTQMFTERYMVEWLLQNSLGLTWLCICKRNGWTADAEKVLPVLDARRAEWRRRREAGEVALDALMPIEGELEEAWKYYVPQPLPADLEGSHREHGGGGGRGGEKIGDGAGADGSGGAEGEGVGRLASAPAAAGLDGRREGAGGVSAGGVKASQSDRRDPDPNYSSSASSASATPAPSVRTPAPAAPRSIRDVRLLDPACGSGHFLCSAFDLFVLMYREEARHCGQTISDKEIAESILTRNLHGVDIDPRAVQIAAAGLYLKAKTLSREARPSHLNLVAPTLQLGNLPDDDPALVELLSDLKQEAGIPEDLTRRLVASLAGVDHLGTLLKVDAAVNEALSATNLEFERQGKGQGDFFGGFPQQQVKLTVGEAKATVLDKLEQFLSKHSASEDLGLRLDGEQLAAGVRFVRLVREGSYDVVVGNPPYHGVGKLQDSDYYVKHYKEGRPDLFAGFYLRGLELACDGGMCAQITLSNWMFLGVFRELRGAIRRNTLIALADLGKAAFTTGGTLISTTCAVVRRGPQTTHSVAIRPHSPEEVVRDDGQPHRTEAALLLHRGRYEFDPKGFEVIEGEPIVYWWTKDFLARYATAPKLGETSPARLGVTTGENSRFLRKWHELQTRHVCLLRVGVAQGPDLDCWVPYVLGAKGRCWFDPLMDVIRWMSNGLQLKESPSFVRNSICFFQDAVAFSTIGSKFGARGRRYKSAFDVSGSSVFPPDVPSILCLMNSKISRQILQDLNPTVNFQPGDVNRLPVFPVANSDEIFATIDRAFTEHESARESSVEFKRPGPSPWRYAQDWAQRAVDRPEGAPLPPYQAEYDSPEPAAFVSFALGVALGRFGADGEGILDRAPATALPHGILFLGEEGRDSLEHPACAPLLEAWKEYGAAVGEGDDLRTYLQRSFFDWHKRLYENRPIYFPLSSAKRGYVAFISIHRWQDDTLQVLLADHLLPERRRLEGELDDIRKARTEAKGRGKAERRFAEVSKLLEELSDFIAKLTEVAEHGPPAPDDKTPKREQDARFAMDLDDGVMVNSAALWPLLEPQWKDPKKWWKELATAQGRKDYDWSHLAARYFPSRVCEKCVQDPSLAVAHHCFWELHPAKAYAWELRLQDEIRPDFTIDEPNSFQHRAAFLKAHPEEVEAAQTKEAQRRARKAAKDTDDDTDTPLLDRTEEEEPADA
jgi:hypothetical protein